ncbi:MAG TPA: histidine phosphatase family protein [Solirubrobacteraceae bacterium]|jgi:phosphohistidine phosphatase|nr:histidine phosphatase family protein [Solirubrobacteraceae bacterium]
MARQLWLLRHAEAEPHGTRTDAARRLTDRGRAQARVAGIAIGQLHSGFEQVVFSPKVRAQETAELAAEGWDPQQRELLRVHPPLAGGFDAAQALDAVSGIGADGRLLMVGHEPDLSHVIAQLTGGRVDVKKGGLAIVRLEGMSGELVALMRPRELVLIAGGLGGVPIHGD